MALLNTAHGKVEPTHCFSISEPRCIDHVLVSPTLLQLCTLCDASLPTRHSMLITTIDVSKMALQTDVPPPGRVQFSKIRHDLHLGRLTIPSVTSSQLC